MARRALALWVISFSFSYACSFTFEPLESWNGRNTVRPSTSTDVLKELIGMFTGEFDNYNQILEERKRDIVGKQEGAHEHVHCTLSSIDKRHLRKVIDDGSDGKAIIARYYIHGNPELTYRYRVYTFQFAKGEEQSKGDVVMYIWRFAPTVEAKLKSIDYNLIDFNSSLDEASAAENSAEMIEGCRIFWKKTYNPVRNSGEVCFIGSLGDDDGIWIASPSYFGSKILIKDDITLTKQTMTVNDRGYDERGDIIYGNRFSVPYEYLKVDEINGLDWTVDAYRNDRELYVEKMKIIGIDVA